MILSVTIPASGTTSIKAKGSHFTCVSTTATFALRIDNGSLQDTTAGTRFKVRGHFDTLAFVNTSLADIVCRIYYGSEEYVSPDQTITGTVGVSAADIASIRGSPQTLATTGSGSLAADAVVTVAANALRKSIIIGNQDATLYLMIRATAGGADLIPVPPMTAIELVTSAAVSIHNPNLGAAVVVGVLQTIWT